MPPAIRFIWRKAIKNATKNGRRKNVAKIAPNLFREEAELGTRTKEDAERKKSNFQLVWTFTLECSIGPKGPRIKAQRAMAFATEPAQGKKV